MGGQAGQQSTQLREIMSNCVLKSIAGAARLNPAHVWWPGKQNFGLISHFKNCMCETMLGLSSSQAGSWRLTPLGKPA